MIQLAAALGSRGLRFGSLMPTAETAMRGLDLSPQERREVEAEIRRLQRSAPIPTGMAPGYYHESPFFPCGPLELEEFNVDYRGNVTLCCQLSGYSNETSRADVIGNLREISLTEACARFRERVGIYLEEKRLRVSQERFEELDHFPCWYCVRYLKKTSALENLPLHSWMQPNKSERGVLRDQIATSDTYPS
jgi:hypothetical protein